MNIFLNILIWILVILLVLILIILFIPIFYHFNISYCDGLLVIKGNIFVVNIDISLYKLKNPNIKISIFNLCILNKKNEIKDDNKKNKTIGLFKKTYFQNRNLAEEVNNSNEVSKELLKSAKRAEKENKKNSKKDKKGKKDLGIINTIKVILYILKELKPTVKNIRPKKCIVNMVSGILDPAMTGMLLAILSPLYSIYGDSIKIKPSFGFKGADCKIELYGSVQLIYIAILGLKILFYIKKKEKKEKLYARKKRK